MLNFEHEIVDIKDRYLRYFFGWDYFHDGVIHQIQSIDNNDIELVISCNREWEEDYKLFDGYTESSQGYDKFMGHIFDDKYKYICRFKDCRYFSTEVFDNGFIFLNGRFKDSAVVNRINDSSNKHYLHLRIQTTEGFVDIVFSKFKISKMIGEIKIPNKVPKRLLFEWVRKKYDNTSLDTIRDIAENGDDIDRMIAIHYLGYIKDNQAVLLAIKALTVEDAQISAIWVLGNLGEESVLPVLYNEWAVSEGKYKRHIQDAIEKINYRISKEDQDRFSH